MFDMSSYGDSITAQWREHRMWCHVGNDFEEQNELPPSAQQVWIMPQI
jgi:hypothetical protein